MAETNPPQAPKTRRWSKLVLFASLAFNLLVIGLVAGAFLSGPRGWDRSPLLREIGFGPFVQALPRSEKTALTRSLRQEAGAFRENRAALRRQFDALLAALRAEPYDHAEVSRLITEGQNRLQDRQRLGRALLLDRIGSMDAASRASYADELETALRHRRNRPPRGD